MRAAGAFAGDLLAAAPGLVRDTHRAISGRVVDFMNVGIGPIRTGVFNVADMAIMFGAAIFMIGEIRKPER